MVDWSNLPHDVLMLIAQRFGLLRDLSLFASVCAQWRDVAREVRRTFLYRPPLLMLPFKEGTHTTRDFYDLSTNSVYSINLPELDDQWICGASNGWLVTLDVNLKIELLNPYSKTKLQLPHHPAIFDHQEGVYQTYRWCYMHKVILTESPDSNRACLAVSLVSNWKRLAVCRVGDDKWTDVETELNRYSDITCYEGKLLAIGERAPLVILDARQDFKAAVVNAPDYPLLEKGTLCKKYLVESAGDLLLVARLSRLASPSLAFKTYRFDVYKLNERTQGWTKVENLGDQSIFVGGSHSISAKVCGISGFRPNCIYYLEDFTVTNNPRGCQFDCGLFCLADGHTKPLPEEVLSFWSGPGFWCMQSL